MSQEVKTMTLRSLFEKQIFVRLTEDHAAFICTTKWPLLSRTRRVGLDKAGLGSMVPEELPVLRRSAEEPSFPAEKNIV